MIRSRESRSASIHDALSAVAGRVERRGPDLWFFRWSNAASLAVQVRLEEDWLVLDAEAPDADGRSHWDLLLRNASLPGPAKLVLSGAERTPGLRAEIPLDAVRDGALTDRLRRTFSLLGRASPGGDGGCGPQRRGPRDLGALCDGAGWPHREAKAGGRSVELQAIRGTFRATLEDRGAAGVRAAVVAARFDALTEASRGALGLFLLSASGALRGARAAAAGRSDGGAEVRFEAWLGDPPTAEACHEALCALSIACDAWGPVTRVLGDPSIAGEYLRARPPGRRGRPRIPRPANRTNRSNRGNRGRKENRPWVLLPR